MSDIKEVALSFPLTFTTQGVLETTTSQDKIWADRVLSVIGTGWGERILRQEFGTRIYKQQLSTVSEAETAITREVAEAFDTFLPSLILIDTITEFSLNTRTLSIDVLYKLPDETTSKLRVGTVVINNNLPPEEN